MRTRSFVHALLAVLVLSIFVMPVAHAADATFTWSFSSAADYQYNASEISVTDDAARMLTLEGGIYPTTAAIMTKTGINFTELSGFSAEMVGNVRFQLSVDGAVWYSMSGSGWHIVSTDSGADTMTATDLNIAIRSFAHDVETGTLHIKAVLYGPSGTELVPVLSAMTVTYVGEPAPTGTDESEQCFTDVPKNHPDFLAICELKTRGVVSGVDADHFFPNTVVRRGESFKIATGGRDVSAYATAENPFVDLPSTHTLKAWILYLFHNGVISGYDATHVGPDNTLTEAESAKVILNLNGIVTETPPAGITYGLPSGSNLIPFVHTAITKNLLRGGSAEFHANSGMTRGKIATLMYRVLIMNENDWASYHE